MPVRELLATHTSRELAEWRAFEFMNGFEDTWTQEVLSDIHEQIQWLAHLMGMIHMCEDGDTDSNPIPPPKRYPRRYERRSKFGFEIAEQEAAEAAEREGN